MQIPHRFRAACWLGVAASIVGIALAVWPGGHYDAQLAIYTATFIALVWYNFLAYCALNRAEESFLKCNITKGEARTINVVVTNPTHERRITFRWRVLGWRNGHPIEIQGTCHEDSLHYLTLRPGEDCKVEINLPPAVPGPEPFGSALSLGELEKAILRLDIVWRDDLKEQRSIEPEFWEVNVHNCQVRRYQNVTEAEKEWITLGGQVTDALTMPRSQKK